MKLNSFVNSYLETAAWVTCDSGENVEFTDEAKIQAKNDCNTFITLVSIEFGFDKANDLLSVGGEDLTYLAAHDFFLTRNGHGSGFWDKPETYGGQENADTLTKICKMIGEVDCYHIDGEESQLTF